MLDKFYFSLLTILFCSSLWANDSSVGLDSGNIVFKKSDGIIMLSEDLFISPQETRVRYQFKNETSADIKTQVGFPISPMEIDGGDHSFDTASDDPLSFSTWVNGKKVNTQVHRKEKYKKDEFSTVEFTYYWDQLFPAEKTIVVEHHYRTAPTGFVGGTYKDLVYDYEKKYCMKETFSTQKRKSKKYYSAQYTNYILTTANNWKGTIGDFHLIIDKQRPDTLISLCATDINKINPTQFEMRKKNFKPEKDLAILFLYP